MPTLFRRADDRPAAPIRGPASLLYGGAAVKRSGAPLRLFDRGLPGAVPRFSPPRAAGVLHGDPTGSTRAAQEEPRAWPGRGPAQAQLLGLRDQPDAQGTGNAVERHR